MGDLSGKTILVTGATSGIGLEACVVFAQRGASVVMIGRDPARTKAAVEQVTRRSGVSGSVESLLCDFASQKQIRALAEAVRAKYPRIDVLVNNAGLVYEKRTLTEDGIEATYAVNHLGPFLFTELILDRVVAAAPSRIVNVSSLGHNRATMNLADVGFEKDYGIMKAYGRSKLGNVLFTRALAKRLEGKNVTVNCLHPGAVATNIWSRAPAWTKPLLAVIKSLIMITPEQGGQTLVYAATSPELEGKTGLYLEKNRPVYPSRVAQDEALAEQVWAHSAKLVGLPA